MLLERVCHVGDGERSPGQGAGDVHHPAEPVGAERDVERWVRLLLVAAADVGDDADYFARRLSRELQDAADRRPRLDAGPYELEAALA